MTAPDPLPAQLRDLFAVAYLTALNPPVLPVTVLPRRVPLDDTRRAPITRLRATEGGTRA